MAQQKSVSEEAAGGSVNAVYAAMHAAKSCKTKRENEKYSIDKAIPTHILIFINLHLHQTQQLAHKSMAFSAFLFNKKYDSPWFSCSMYKFHVCVWGFQGVLRYGVDTHSTVFAVASNLNPAFHCSVTLSPSPNPVHSPARACASRMAFWSAKRSMCTYPQDVVQSQSNAM